MRAQGLVWDSFWSILGVRRLLGKRLEPACVPGAAWIRFSKNCARQIELKGSQKAFQHLSKNHEIRSMFLDAFLGPFCSQNGSGAWAGIVHAKIDENDDIIWEWILS